MTIEQTRRLLTWVSKQSDLTMIGMPAKDLVMQHAKLSKLVPLYKDEDELRLLLIYLSTQISFSPNPQFKFQPYEIGFIRMLIAKDAAPTLAQVDRKILCKQFVKAWAILYGHRKHEMLMGNVPTLSLMESDDIFAQIDNEAIVEKQIPPEIAETIQRAITEVKANVLIVEKLASKSTAKSKSVANQGNKRELVAAKEPDLKKKRVVDQAEETDSELLLTMKEMHTRLIRLRSL